MSSLLSAFDVKEDIIDFSIGAPGPKLLEKARILISSANKTFDQLATAGRKDFQQIFQYGPNCGSPVFINALASFLSSEYQDFVCPESLILTAGATQGLHLIASTQLDKKNGVVFVENPTTGINAIMNSLNFGPEDTILMINTEQIDTKRVI